MSDLISEAIDIKVHAYSGINSAILSEPLKNMETLLLQRMDDLDSSNTQPVAAALVAHGVSLDRSDLQRRNMFTYDGKFW